MRVTGLSFGLLAVLAHVGVHAAPVEDKLSSPNVIRAAEANPNRDLATIVNIINDDDDNDRNRDKDRDDDRDRDRDRDRDDDEIIIKIRNRQRKNQQRDKKKDDKRIDSYRNRNRDKNTVIIVINIIEVRGSGYNGFQFGKDQGRNNTAIAEGEKEQKEKEQAQKDQEQKDQEQIQEDQEQKDEEQEVNEQELLDQAQKDQEEKIKQEEEQKEQAQKDAGKNATEAVGDVAGKNLAANGTVDNVIRTMYATHTLLADNGSKETDTVQVFDYQKTDIVVPTGNAVGAVPTSATPAAENKDIVLPTDGAAAPSYAECQPDPADPAVAGL